MSTKKITLERVNKAVNFKATNEEGISMMLDGSPSLGGIGNGVRPMESLLMALAACSAIDVVMILDKMRQKLEDIKIEVSAESSKIQDYTTYTSIHLEFLLKGKLKESKVEKAVSSSMEKYCSVAKIMEKSSRISFTYKIIDQD